MNSAGRDSGEPFHRLVPDVKQTSHAGKITVSLPLGLVPPGGRNEVSVAVRLCTVRLFAHTNESYVGDTNFVC